MNQVSLKDILVLEDESNLHPVIQMKLEKEGFGAMIVRSVNEALGVLDKTPSIRAIWVDHYLLGKETGLDFVIKMKESDRWKGVPIFIVSNTAGPEKKEAYLKLGVVRYYVKAEHRLDEIVRDIKEFLRQEN